jgi:hypothetical protein
MKKLWLAMVLTLVPFASVIAQPVLENPLNLNSSSSLVSPQTGVDYTPLQEFLANQQWRRANEETLRLMLKATNRELQGWVSTNDIKTFACWDLATIDRLWSQYSGGHFGLKVQYQIFVETGNRPGKLLAVEKYQDFGDRIGWRANNDWIIFKENLNYSLDAPIGHLPAPRREYQITGARLEYTTLAQRMVECNLVTAPTVTTPTVTTPTVTTPTVTPSPSW